MRTKILLLTSIAVVMSALAVIPMTAADAAGSYKVNAVVSDGTLDLTSGDGSNRSTKIKGKVTGGPVKGKKVYIYAKNVSTKSAPHKYIGTAKLSSSGAFSRTWKPTDGGRYEIDVVKKAGSGKGQGSDGTRVYVYQYVDLKKFFDDASSTSAAEAPREKYGSGQYNVDEYAITGGGKAVFDTGGYYCMRVIFKAGLSTTSQARHGTIRVKQSKTLVSHDVQDTEVYEPPSSTQKKMNATDAITFSVDARDDLDDQTKLRMIVGRPRVACTFPTHSTPYR